MNKEKNKDLIKIYSSPNGVKVIQSPIKKEILSLLNDNGLSGSEIVANTGKSKSTISVHLEDLIDLGIVGWKVDPKDRRKKIYYTKSKLIGGIKNEKEIESDLDDYLEEIVLKSKDPFRFFRFMFRTIRMSLLEEGIDIEPMLRKAGLKVGKTFYRQLKADDLTELSKNLAKFWEENQLGRLEIESLDPPIIKAYDCFECGDLPQIGRPACAFDRGMLEAIFSSFYKSKVTVGEMKCFAMGDQCCQFLIELTD